MSHCHFCCLFRQNKSLLLAIIIIVIKYFFSISILIFDGFGYYYKKYLHVVWVGEPNRNSAVWNTGYFKGTVDYINNIYLCEQRITVKTKHPFLGNAIPVSCVKLKRW